MKTQELEILISQKARNKLHNQCIYFIRRLYINQIMSDIQMNPFFLAKQLSTMFNLVTTIVIKMKARSRKLKSKEFRFIPSIIKRCSSITSPCYNWKNLQSWTNKLAWYAFHPRTTMFLWNQTATLQVNPNSLSRQDFNKSQFYRTRQ